MFLRLLQHRPILLPHGGLVATSYGHVDDLCELMVAMVGQPAARGEVFNVTAEGLTSLRYVQELAAIVGAEPDIVYVPDDVLPSLTRPVFGHLFGVRHHAIASIDKATSAARLPAPLRLRRRPRRDVRLVPGAGLGRPQRRPQRPGVGRQLGLRRRGRGRGDVEVTDPSRDRGARASERRRDVDVGRGDAARRRPARPRRPPPAAGRHPPDGRRRVRARPRRRSEPHAARPSSRRSSTVSSGTATSSARQHWREGAPPDPRDVLAATSAVLVAAVDAGATATTPAASRPRCGRSWPATWTTTWPQRRSCCGPSAGWCPRMRSTAMADPHG